MVHPNNIPIIGRPQMVEIKFVVSADVAERIALQTGTANDRLREVTLVAAALLIRSGATGRELATLTEAEMLAAAGLASHLGRQVKDGKLHLFDQRIQVQREGGDGDAQARGEAGDGGAPA